MGGIAPRPRSQRRGQVALPNAFSVPSKDACPRVKRAASGLPKGRGRLVFMWTRRGVQRRRMSGFLSKEGKRLLATSRVRLYELPVHPTPHVATNGIFLPIHPCKDQKEDAWRSKRMGASSLKKTKSEF